MDDPQDSSATSAGARAIHRVQARATLFAAPDTLITARDFARIMGLRFSTAYALKPPSLRRKHRSKLAPFREWLAAWEQLEQQPEPPPAPEQPSLAELRARSPKR